MVITKFKCKKCGSTEYYLRKWEFNSGGTAIGVHCTKCNTQYKFLGKNEKMAGKPAYDYTIQRMKI